jgi:hypothetical protein
LQFEQTPAQRSIVITGTTRPFLRFLLNGIDTLAKVEYCLTRFVVFEQSRTGRRNSKAKQREENCQAKHFHNISFHIV